jgi:hypothetical protein
VYEYDSYDQWMNGSSMAMGLMSYIEQSGEEDEEVAEAGSYYWGCFDQEDEELNELVTTRE